MGEFRGCKQALQYPVVAGVVFTIVSVDRYDALSALPSFDWQQSEADFNIFTRQVDDSNETIDLEFSLQLSRRLQL